MDIPFEKIDKSTYSESSRRILENWQDRAIELASQQDFVQHIVTKQLAEMARGFVEAAKDILANDESMSEIDRKALQKAKKIHEIYLSIFTRDVSDEIALIEKQVQDEIS